MRAFGADDDAPFLPGPFFASAGGSFLASGEELAAAIPMGASVKLLGKGLRTGRFCDPILDAGQLVQLTITPKEPPFDGDAQRFRLGEGR